MIKFYVRRRTTKSPYMRNTFISFEVVAKHDNVIVVSLTLTICLPRKRGV